MATSWEVLQSYLIETYEGGNTFNPVTLLERRSETSFLTPLSYYLEILDNTDLVMFPYMFPEDETSETRAKKKREQLKHDLQVARLLIEAQATYEVRHQKNENLLVYIAQIDKCNLYLTALESKEEAIRANLPQPQGANTPVIYLGYALGQELAEQIEQVASSKTKNIKTAMGKLNEKRLYWIWGSSLLKTVLSSFPDDFFNSQQAGGAIRTPDPYTSCLSWLLYLSRFSLNLGLLLKHTVPWWLTDEEKKIPWTERFKTQWEQRKFTLLNDSLWGMANLLCALWLTGKGALGGAGDVLTIGLLAFDIAVSLWDFSEQQANHNAELEQLEKDMHTLREKIAELKSQIFAESEKEEEEKKRDFAMHQLALQLTDLERAKARAEKNWELNKYGLYNNIGYAVGLMLAFVIMTTPFMPIPAAAVAAVGLAGAILCFAFTVISNAIRNGVEIHRTRFELRQNEDSFIERIGMLKEMLRTHTDLNDNEKKFLFLEIKKLQATTEYQSDLVMYQTINMVRSIMIEAMIPAIIFSSLVFFPLGIGLGALGAALGLAIASNLLINKMFKPDEKMKQLPQFSEEEYTEFCDLAQKEGKSSSDYHSFFRKRLRDTKSSDVDTEMQHADEQTPLLPGAAPAN